MQQRNLFIPLALAAIVSGCATVDPVPTAVEAPVSREQQQTAQEVSQKPTEKQLKRKIAIGRFTNETKYGKALLTDKDLDPLGKQASDILSNRLVDSDKFLVFERPDLTKIKREQQRTGESNIIGADTLIVGSITEFGRHTVGKTGFLSGTKKQIARAKVEIRFVNTKTAHVFFTANGVGEASTESGQVAGFGSKSRYDATLNDKAIGAAISDVIDEIIVKLEEQPWQTDILKIEGKRLFISGGERQGLKVGDTLRVMEKGETVRSQQSGFDISLPPSEIAKIRVVSLFGDSEANEGAVAELVEGELGNVNRDKVFVAEGEK